MEAIVSDMKILRLEAKEFLRQEVLPKNARGIEGPLKLLGEKHEALRVRVDKWLNSCPASQAAVIRSEELRMEKVWKKMNRFKSEVKAKIEEHRNDLFKVWLVTKISTEEGNTCAQVIEEVRERVAHEKISGANIVSILWGVMMDCAGFGRRGRVEENSGKAVKQVEKWGGLMRKFCYADGMKQVLMDSVLLRCKEDERIKKGFVDLMSALNRENVLLAANIIAWYNSRIESETRRGKKILKALKETVTQMEEMEEDDE